MHMQWASRKNYTDSQNGGFSQPFRPGNTPLQVFTDSYEWTSNDYDYLGDSFSAHINPIFWKLHGWVDDTVTAWARAHGWADVYEPEDCRVDPIDGLAYETATRKPVTDIFGGQLGYCVTFESKWLGDAPTHGAPPVSAVVSETIVVTPTPAEIETVTIPAVFETVTRRVKADENCVDTAEAPCAMIIVEERVMVSPARTEERAIPATTRAVTKRVAHGQQHGGHHGHHGPSVLEKAKNLATSNPEAVRSILNNQPLPMAMEKTMPAAMVPPAPTVRQCEPTKDMHGHTIPCVQETVTETVVMEAPHQQHGGHHGHHGGHHGGHMDKELTAHEKMQWTKFVEEETSKVENFRNMDLAIDTSSQFTDDSVYLETLNNSLKKISELKEEIRLTGGTDALNLELVRQQSYIPALQEKVKADRAKKRQGLLDAVRKDISKKIK